MATKFYEDQETVKSQIERDVQELIDTQNEELTELIEGHKNALSELLTEQVEGVLSLIEDGTFEWDDEGEPDLRVVHDVVDDVKNEILSNPFMSCRENDWCQSLQHDVDF